MIYVLKMEGLVDMTNIAPTRQIYKIENVDPNGDTLRVEYIGDRAGTGSSQTFNNIGELATRIRLENIRLADAHVVSASVMERLFKALAD